MASLQWLIESYKLHMAVDSQFTAGSYLSTSNEMKGIMHDPITEHAAGGISPLPSAMTLQKLNSGVKISAYVSKFLLMVSKHDNPQWLASTRTGTQGEQGPLPFHRFAAWSMTQIFIWDQYEETKSIIKFLAACSELFHNTGLYTGPERNEKLNHIDGNQKTACTMS